MLLTRNSQSRKCIVNPARRRVERRKGDIERQPVYEELLAYGAHGWRSVRGRGVPANASATIEGGRQPYAIARIDSQSMAFDGLWEGFKWPDGTVLRTFTIITTNANETVGQLHNSMPVILEQQDWPTWLGEVEGDPATLLRPADDHVLKVWPVSKQVNSPRNNGLELLERTG
jgi:putative SOS response-associated peptidase YedK